MSLPAYLENHKTEIRNALPQQIFLWHAGYHKFKSYKPVDELYLQFPDRNLQREDVVKIMKEDAYKGFIAGMIWGGINGTKPLTKGGKDTALNRLLSCPVNQVTKAIDYARKEISAGNLVSLFNSFSPGGLYKLPGIDSSYFTKLFYFLGEVEGNNVALKPLIWDKWTANAHCALSIQLGQQVAGRPIAYPGINKHAPFSLQLPVGAAKARLYHQYVADFNHWAKAIPVSPGQLEAFVFGQSLKQGKRTGNPRIDLWHIIEGHFNTSDNAGINEEAPSIAGNKQPGPVKGKQHSVTSQAAVALLASGTKYYPLQQFMEGCSLQGQNQVMLSVGEIEKITGKALPDWAFTRAATFWGNSGYSDHIQKRAWLSQGYYVSLFSIEEASRTGSITFTMITESPPGH